MIIPWMIAGVLGLIAGIFLMQAQSKQKQLNKINKTLKQSRALADNLQQQQNSGRSEVEDLRKNNRELKAKQKKERKKAHEMRQELDSLKQQLADLKSDTSGEAEILRLREELEEFQILRSQLEKERSQLETEYEQRMRTMQSDIFSDKDRLEQENKKMKRDLNSAERRVSKLEHDLNREKKRVGGEKSQMKRLETRASNNDRAFRVTQNELHRAHRQLRELVEENAQLKQQLNADDASSEAVEDAKATLNNNLGLNETEMFESSAEEFIESLDGGASHEEASANDSSESTENSKEAGESDSESNADTAEEPEATSDHDANKDKDTVEADKE